MPGEEPAPPVFGYAEIKVTRVPRPFEFVRGDCNDSGRVDVSDSITVLEPLFFGGGTPPCADACDADDS